MALEITDATFEEVVLKSDKPVMVDFWAAWCGPCRMVGPIIDEISSDYEGKAIVGKLDVDANQEFAAKYGVRNIPTVLVFKDGEVVGRQVGVAPKTAYAQALDTIISTSRKKNRSRNGFFLGKNKKPPARWFSFQYTELESYLKLKCSYAKLSFCALDLGKETSSRSSPVFGCNIWINIKGIVYDSC